MKHSKHTKHFASRWGFILASVGSAVGMANVWGFPNKLGSNGGGAFLIVYLLFVFIFSHVALPAEFAMGRHAATGTLGAYENAWATRGEKLGKAGGRSRLAAAGWFFVHCDRLRDHCRVYSERHWLTPLSAYAHDCGHSQLVRLVLLGDFSVVPYHVIVVVGTLLTLYLRRAQHRKDQQDHDADCSS